MTFYFLFQSTLHQISTHILTKRMTMLELAEPPQSKYFNSHPHEEDDETEEREKYEKKISTHILTKRMTAFFLSMLTTSHISTHILTKRMTLEQEQHNMYLEHFNSHPHEEDDVVVCLTCSAFFISTHILTKRMTVNTSTFKFLSDISTHILTKRMTIQDVTKELKEIFQLTSSRRG